MRTDIPIAVASVVVILAALPLAMKRVPKNTVYGMRTPRVMSGNEALWYRANAVAGKSFLMAGGVALMASITIPSLIGDSRKASMLCAGILAASVVIAGVVSARLSAEFR